MLLLTTHSYQLCQFWSSEKQTPQWNMMCERIVGETLVKVKGQRGQKEIGRLLRLQCKCHTGDRKWEEKGWCREV